MDQKQGYWGPVTSSIDWCEENYQHSWYIAEFWNTVSSVAMVILGLLGVKLHYRSLGWRFSAGYLFIVVVGIGSVLFHATLQYEHQMWDEVPMIWTACYLLWLLLQEHGYAHLIYGVAIAIYCVIATLLTSKSKGTTQFYLFQSTFGLVMWSCFWFVRSLYKHAQSPMVRSIFHRGVQFLVLAISVWLFDGNFCFVYDHVPNPQLHAWWHILMCVSLHYFFVAAGHEMISRKDKSSRLKIKYLIRDKFIPFVALEEDHRE
ncbi:alkaline phytoceramidase family protein [Backusella circina FSU 941]|nr:alkaline phytoceramidase family protein [Backusella circina FSU 941]